MLPVFIVIAVIAHVTGVGDVVVVDALAMQGACAAVVLACVVGSLRLVARRKRRLAVELQRPRA